MDSSEKINNLFKWYKRTPDLDTAKEFFEELPFYYTDPSDTSTNIAITTAGRITFKNEVYSASIDSVNPFIADSTYSSYVCFFQVYFGGWRDYIRPYEHLEKSPLEGDSAYSDGSTITSFTATLGDEWTSGTVSNYQWRLNEDALTAALGKDLADSTIDFDLYKDAFAKKYLGGALLSTSNTNIVKVINLKLYYVEETAASTSTSGRNIKFYHDLLKQSIPSNFGDYLDDQDRTTVGSGKLTYTLSNINTWSKIGSITDKSYPAFYDGNSGYLLTWKGKSAWESTTTTEEDLYIWTSQQDGAWLIQQEAGILAFYDTVTDTVVDFLEPSSSPGDRYYTPWITFYRYEGTIGVADDSGTTNADSIINGDLTVNGSITCTDGYSLVNSSGSSSSSTTLITDRIIINPYDFDSYTGSAVSSPITIVSLINLPYKYKATNGLLYIYDNSTVQIVISKIFLSTTSSVDLVNISTLDPFTIDDSNWSLAEWISDPFYLKISITFDGTFKGGYLDISTIQ